ncbi:hypothetical protein O5904_23880, partial [Escherichia coli]|nr:hypothetical protein [Escherichia coli]
ELGRMQKNLFDKGRTPKDKDYLDVMHKIITLCAEAKEVILRNSDIYKEMELLKQEIKIIKQYYKNKYQALIYLIKINPAQFLERGLYVVICLLLFFLSDL